MMPPTIHNPRASFFCYKIIWRGLGLPSGGANSWHVMCNCTILIVAALALQTWQRLNLREGRDSFITLVELTESGAAEGNQTNQADRLGLRSFEKWSRGWGALQPADHNWKSLKQSWKHDIDKKTVLKHSSWGAGIFILGWPAAGHLDLVTSGHYYWTSSGLWHAHLVICAAGQRPQHRWGQG